MPLNSAPKFWARINIAAYDCCWLWTGKRDRDGYGRVGWHRKEMLAHRLAYSLANAQWITSEVIVRHTCDNPPCCNPSHLVPGSHADNVADCRARGRRAPRTGSRNPRARLTPDDVLNIRQSHLSNAKLSAKYGVAPSTIRDAKTGRNWSSVT